MDHLQDVELEKELSDLQSSGDYSDESEQYDLPYTVLITNLSIKTTESEISSLFGDPKIESIEIVTINKDKVACVTFSDLVSLKAGLLFDERMFNGRFIEIAYCTLEDLIHYEMENGITLNKSVFYLNNGPNVKNHLDLENGNEFDDEEDGDDDDNFSNTFDDDLDSHRGKNSKNEQQKKVWKKKQSTESVQKSGQPNRQPIHHSLNGSLSPNIEAGRIVSSIRETSSPTVQQKRGDTFRIIRQKSSQSSSGDLQNSQPQESNFKRESSRDSNNFNRSNNKYNATNYKQVDSPNRSPQIKPKRDNEYGKSRNSFQAQPNQRKHNDHKNRHYRKNSDNQGSNDRRYQNNDFERFQMNQKESAQVSDHPIPTTSNEIPTITDIEIIEIIPPKCTFVRGRGQAKALSK